MKKIAIITLFGNTNYGNRLQNYAVQTIFEKKGFQADTIDFYLSKTRRIKAALKYELDLARGKPTAKRDRLMKEFNKKHIHVRPVSASGGMMPTDLKNEYDFFAVGSDQVWNPEIRRNQRDIMFLEFAEKKQRIAVSPSIGVSKIEDEYVDDLRQRLDGFTYLSCREKAGAQEIERITGRSCQHLLDPTLVLTAEEWRLAAASDRFDSQEQYAFVFFLGKISPELKGQIKDFCGRENLSIKMIVENQSNFAPVSPFGFVNLIDNARIVFTDSFHGTVFSINMETPFYVFNRNDKHQAANRVSSRIESIVDLFDLRDRYQSFNFNIACDFAKAQSVLSKERERFMRYIDMSVGVSVGENNE